MVRGRADAAAGDVHLRHSQDAPPGHRPTATARAHRSRAAAAPACRAAACRGVHCRGRDRARWLQAPACRGPEAGTGGGRQAAGIRRPAVGTGAEAARSVRPWHCALACGSQPSAHESQRLPGTPAEPRPGAAHRKHVLRNGNDRPRSWSSTLRTDGCGQHCVRRPARGSSPGTPSRRSPSRHKHRPAAQIHWPDRPTSRWGALRWLQRCLPAAAHSAAAGDLRPVRRRVHCEVTPMRTSRPAPVRGRPGAGGMSLPRRTRRRTAPR